MTTQSRRLVAPPPHNVARAQQLFTLGGGGGCMSAPDLCWTCQHPQDAERQRKIAAKKAKTRRQKQMLLTRDFGCVWVRMARDSVSKAFRILRRLEQDHSRCVSDWEKGRAIIQNALDKKQIVRDATVGLKALTPIGEEELEAAWDYFNPPINEHGYAAQIVYVRQKRLTAHALCSNALRDLMNCEGAYNHPRGKRARQAAVALIEWLDSTADGLVKPAEEVAESQTPTPKDAGQETLGL